MSSFGLTVIWIPYVHILDTLRPVGVPYSPSLPEALYQQDNARPHVSHLVLNYVNMQGIRLLSCPAWFPDLSLIKNIWAWAVERLVRHPSPANTFDEV
ncbi:hypothetical protein TNCV_967421 [Trichonephila clavipes]|nr:hypothetical protein TNCV_967421 [Trichonephila clavipes]